MSVAGDPLEELERRRALTGDEARADKVAARHASGGRTARENLDALLDPGSFVEYGRLASAAQEKRLGDRVLERSPADGLIAGIGAIDGTSCAVLSYDYLVMAGTQGIRGHHKSDRLLGLIEELRLPVVFFAEGGGGRPTDTDYPVVSALDVRTFALWAGLSGLVPRIAVVAGHCFAGNAVIAGSSDILIATQRATMGVAGPAMVAGAGLGDYTPEQLGPSDVMSGNGVIDVLVPDEAAAVATARHVFGLFAGPVPDAGAADQRLLREALPQRERVPYDVRPIITTLADFGSVVFLREQFAPELVTALARIEGRSVGILANQTLHMAGALTAAAGDKAARFVQMCDALGVPLLSLVDTPGIMAGPEAERTGILRHASRLLVATARLTVPLIGVVLRRGYGLGAQAMLGGSTKEPLATVAWPSAHMGPMGLEGAVRLAMGKQLDAIADPAERQSRFQEATNAYRQHVAAFNAARVFEIDDVIDPAQTRGLVARLLAAAPARPSGRHIDTW
ncbi:MAG: biotin carboxylase [Actinobacteria bacterium]|nr:biotin carboxylase [Actinomycetota bacterium]MCB8996418.1 biotin carboxylase [Actinomycetota bacterium]MCB9425312.1 biotin carboxylase [Actinomycetota bacterium]